LEKHAERHSQCDICANFCDKLGSPVAKRDVMISHLRHSHARLRFGGRLKQDADVRRLSQRPMKRWRTRST
jgi:hypothetical protein